ncbi:MAG: trypsin-like peptidase domain-containing protein [Clostridia bacterium]|nr:trypsin-like peptidase domain-containing protein [Clostridia bacterium]
MSEDNKQKEREGSRAVGHGGYSARFTYEKSKKRSRSALKTAGVVALFLILTAFSVLGVVALAKGAFSSDSSGDGGSVRVPSQSELALAAKGTSDMVKELSSIQLVVEAVFEDGSVLQGSGFFLSNDGYAVCSDHVLASESPLTEVYAYTGDGSYQATRVIDRNETLGLLLLKLEGYNLDLTDRMSSGFVSRGDTLYLVGSSHKREYQGTVVSGLAAASGAQVQLERETISVIYVDADPNPTLWGAPAVNELGQVVGFCTKAIDCPWENMTVVIPMANVFVIVNGMMS